MAIKNYKKSENIQLAENFNALEFACHGTGCCTETKIDEKLVQILQQIRDHFGVPVTIASGYRCPVHNAKVSNAASKSKHMYGMAADIKVEGVAPAEVAKYAESIGVLGIGLYETDSDGYFVHVDTRDTKSFWYGHAQAYRSTFGGAVENNNTTKEVYEMNMRILREGDKGEDVKALQILLKGRGYQCGTYGPNGDGVDGDYGKATGDAVEAYQKDHGLAVDRTAGPETMGSLLGVS